MRKVIWALLLVVAVSVAVIAQRRLSRRAATVEITNAGAITLTPATGQGVKVGSGSFLTRVAKYTAALTPVLVAANTCAEQLFTVTGITTADVVFVNKPTAQAGLGIGGVRASAANQVGVTFCNNTAAGITPTAAETYLFGALQ